MGLPIIEVRSPGLIRPAMRERLVSELRPVAKKCGVQFILMEDGLEMVVHDEPKSLRDWFAGKALPWCVESFGLDAAGVYAYRVADATLKARDSDLPIPPEPGSLPDEPAKEAKL